MQVYEPCWYDLHECYCDSDHVLCVDHPDIFYYTNQGEAVVIDGVDDAAEMLTTREAFSLLGQFLVLMCKINVFL